MSQESTVISFDLLSQAIMNKMGVTEDISDEIALRVLNYFGYDEEIIDNVLDQDDRRMFYFLQDVELLSTHWEEVVLPNGRMWRVFYWSLNVSKILEYARPQIEETATEIGLYDSLPEDVWSRPTAHAV
jgi:hypothetical protein